MKEYTFILIMYIVSKWTLVVSVDKHLITT